MPIVKSNEFYNGNASIKKAGVQQSFTPEEITEYVKCQNDVIYFIKNYCKIISLDEGLVLFGLRDYQERMIRSYDDNRFNITLTSRQTGKTTVVAAYLIHYLIFKSHKSVAILANKAATSREILARIKRMLEGLPFFLQPGVKEYNKGSVEFGNESKVVASATSSDSIRGFTFNCVGGDTKITIVDDYERIFYIKISDVNSPKYKYNKHYNLYGENIYYVVYKITNNINQKEYIGYHQTDNLDDGYMGSGKLIKRAIEKHGIDNFTKEYIEIFDNRIDAENLEAILVCEEYTLDNDLIINDIRYNSSANCKLIKQVDKIKKTAESHRGMKRSDECRKNMSLAKIGKIPHNKGKVYCYHPTTLNKKLCNLSEIPSGYVRGYIPKDMNCD